MSRRDFLKLMGAAGVVLTFAPFVDWGKFFPNPRPETASKTKVQLQTGEPANVNTFPIDSSAIVIYPMTNDAVLNKEAFRTWQLIRLPAKLGGDRNDAEAFRMYSSVCLHLWCLWNYFPREKDKNNPGNMKNGNGQCPCHGSMYDPFTGMAYVGPASLQAPPANVLPRLDLEADSSGDLWILPPVWSLDRNGIIGYGRYLHQS
jgi:ubiquinol-cytochrome c reductase iron-sulfur subunit